MDISESESPVLIYQRGPELRRIISPVYSSSMDKSARSRLLIGIYEFQFNESFRFQFLNTDEVFNNKSLYCTCLCLSRNRCIGEYGAVFKCILLENSVAQWCKHLDNAVCPCLFKNCLNTDANCFFSIFILWKMFWWWSGRATMPLPTLYF